MTSDLVADKSKLSSEQPDYFATGPTPVMRILQFRKDTNSQVSGTRAIDRNDLMISRPFNTGIYSANMNFSHGHYILNAGYDKEYDNVFLWEEPYQIYKTWKAGYTMYIPNGQDIFHNWDRTYRPSFKTDARDFSKAKQKKLDGSSKSFMFDSKI